MVGPSDMVAGKKKTKMTWFKLRRKYGIRNKDALAYKMMGFLAMVGVAATLVTMGAISQRQLGANGERRAPFAPHPAEMTRRVSRFLRGEKVTATTTEDEQIPHAARFLSSNNDTNKTQCPEEILAREPTDYDTIFLSYGGLFRFKGDNWGILVPHVIVIAFMFMGLAIICDDYFEAALEGICETLGLKEDVAGATFMAAGGSAPELFTSIMGVFVSKSDVGFGTIIGSAVFNVLFVIALCAYLCPNLPLTWWPLARDSVFYLFAIIVLTCCIQDQNVKLHEAVILLVCYGMYVTIMAFNATLEKWTRKQILAEIKRTKGPSMLKSIVDSAVFSAVIYAVIILNIAAVIIESGAGEDIDAALKSQMFTINIVCAVVFILEMFMKMAAHGKFSYWRDPLNTFDGILVVLIFVEWIIAILSSPNFDSGASSGAARGLRVLRFLRLTRVVRFFRILNSAMHPGDDKATQTDDRDTMPGAGLIVRMPSSRNPFEAEMRAYQAAQRKTAETPDNTTSVNPVPNKKSATVVPLDAQGQPPSATADAQPSTTTSTGPASTTGGTPDSGPPSSSDEPAAEASKQADAGAESAPDDKASAEGEDAGAAADDDDDDDEGPPDIWEVPESACGKFWWAFGWPIAFMLSITVPHPGGKMGAKIWPVTFVMCLFWITFFSYYMVYMAAELGYAFQIPDAVMGLTLLAAGTSIPDALSSLAVAKRGFGDMAVSSSIGSNVFDILIGLPVPWLIACIIELANGVDYGVGGYDGVAATGHGVLIRSSNLVIMILTLFIMVSMVITTIHWAGWKLTHQLANVMMVLYFIFVAESLLLEFNVLFPKAKTAC